VIANHLHDHMSVRQQLQQLAGEATVPYSAVGCCEVDKHNSAFLAEKLSLMSCVSRQGDLIYGRPPVSKSCLFPREQWVDTSVGESLEDFKGDTQQRYGTVSLWGPQWLFCLRDRNY